MTAFDLGRHVRAVGDRLTPWPARMLVKLGVTATLLTVLGFLTAVVGSFELFYGHVYLACLWLIPTGVCDILDGAVARMSKTDHPAGAFLDSCVDRLTDSLPLLALIGAGVDRDRALLVVGALVVSLLIPYVKARGEALGCQVEPGLMPRAVRFVLLFVGLLSGPMTGQMSLSVCLMLIIIGGAYTVYQRVQSCLRQLRDPGPV